MNYEHFKPMDLTMPEHIDLWTRILIWWMNLKDNIVIWKWERFRSLLESRKERKAHALTLCYKIHRNSDGVCYGMYGGTIKTDFLEESCIECPFWTCYVLKQEK